MKQYKTVDEAIRKGQLMVNVPVTIIMIAVPALLTTGLSMMLPGDYVGIGVLIGVFVGIGLGFVLGWTWWSFTIAKWRIWAFENTKKSDWNKLKRRAIKGKLIWEDGNKFEKTEVRNKTQSQKIEKINSFINTLVQEESLANIADDPSIPKKTDYYFKKSETILSLILPLFLMGMGVYLIIDNNLFAGILGIGIGVFLFDLNKIKNIREPEVQISISGEGIDIKKFDEFGFVEWNDTEDISIDAINGILNMGIWEKDEFYNVTLNLNDYEINDYDELLQTMNVYLKRNLDKEKTNDT